MGYYTACCERKKNEITLISGVLGNKLATLHSYVKRKKKFSKSTLKLDKNSPRFRKLGRFLFFRFLFKSLDERRVSKLSGCLRTLIEAETWRYKNYICLVWTKFHIIILIKIYWIFDKAFKFSNSKAFKFAIARNRSVKHRHWISEFMIITFA